MVNPFSLVQRKLFLLPVLLFILSGPSPKAQEHFLHYQMHAREEAPARYGLQRLRDVLSQKQIRLEQAARGSHADLLIGTYAHSPQIRRLVDQGRLRLEKKPEALAVISIPSGGRTQVIIGGYDATGLMYALLDLADALEHPDIAPAPADWLASIPERSESPHNAMRRMRVLLHHKANEDWYRSREYWDWYLGMLATQRFNGLNLVYSHQTSYMAPMYAWHVKVDKYPEVRPLDITEDERRQNLEMLRYVAKTCRDRGIELTIGVWQHMPWKQDYLESREDQNWYVEGLGPHNIFDYTYLAVRKLIEECPGIARIQIRPNDESGIHFRDQTRFYRESVMRAIKDSKSGVKLDLRTVDVHRSTIQAAREANLDVRTSLKFFGEFLGMPYTPQEVMTYGYSYDDYLEKPMPNPVYNEVWMLGSHRVLLWGSEDFGRRFGRNASYGGTIGFETDGPLAQKGYQEPLSPAWRIFKSREDEYFKHEIERYWAFFRCMGRFTYNPDTDREVWLRPFRSRFGASAEAVASAYEAASEVIGLICASHVSNINMYVWPEINMGGTLEVFPEIMGADKGMFPSIRQQVVEELEEKRTGRPGAMGLADKFDRIAVAVEKALAAVRPADVRDAREWRATRDDFQILRLLARYHACRQREGYLFAKFAATSDGTLLGPARTASQQAIRCWDSLASIGETRYYAKMKTAIVENGHWKDKNYLVRSNLRTIDQAAALLKRFGLFDYGFDFGAADQTTAMAIFYPQFSMNSQFVQHRFTGMDPLSRYTVGRGSGFTKNEGLGFGTLPPQPIGRLTGVSPDSLHPPVTDLLSTDFVRSRHPFRFRVDLLPLDTYHFTFLFSDRSEKPSAHGPFSVARVGRTWNDTLLRNLRVQPGQELIRTVRQDLQFDWYPLWEFEVAPGAEGADALLSAFLVHRDRPKIAHARPLRFSPGDIRIGATISLPPLENSQGELSAASQGRLSASLLYYRWGEEGAFSKVPLNSSDGLLYEATIPEREIREGVLQYYFQALTTNGRIARLPAPEGVESVFSVPVTRDSLPPVLEFQPVQRWTAGKPMPVEVRAADPSGVASVRVRFRSMTHTVPYASLELHRQGDRFVGEIPGEAIPGNFDFVYYFEAVDRWGNAAVYPDWETDKPYIFVTIDPAP